MHIVHVETGRHLYGGARQVLMLLSGLAGQGVRCTLVCPPDSAVVTAADGSHTRVRTLPVRGDLDVTFAARLTAELVDLKPDLVHVHSRRGGDLWGGIAATRAGIPAVLSRRVDNPEPRILARLKYGRFARVIAISSAIARQLRRDGLPEAKLAVVRSAIDADACEPTWSRDQFRAAFGLDSDAPVVACVAQLIPRKRQIDLLQALRHVHDARRDARLVLFGRGPDEARLRQQVEQLGLTHAVVFAGFRADLRQFLGCADVLAHPAEREGLGIALLEAQAAGVPVVAVRAGGIPEAVSDASARLVPARDSDALADALLAVLGDSALRARMGTAGREFVRAGFSPAAMVSGNLAVYEHVLADRQTG